MRFIDTDLLIQEQEGKLLREIIAEEGEEGFLKIEKSGKTRPLRQKMRLYRRGAV